MSLNQTIKKCIKSMILILIPLLIVSLVCIFLVMKNSEDKNVVAETELSILMLQVENKIIDVEKLNESEYIDVGKKTAEFINLIGKVETDNVHYFRTYFSRAPESLTDMVQTIKKGNSQFNWQLMLPKDTVLHMYGIDGAFNVKFVSKDGFFEAVYNKNGELLTKDNDPINMGTFNYVSPLIDKTLHTKYDVNTYFKWGNVPESTLSFLKIDPSTNDHLEPQDFNGNKEAVKRYKELYKSINNKDYVDLFE